MKKSLIAFLLLFLPILFYAQTIQEDMVDKNTQIAVKGTTWERLTLCNQFSASCRVVKLDSSLFLYFRIMMGNQQPFSITAGQNLILKFKNGESITLRNFKTTASCMGCGTNTIAGSQVPGIEVSYPLTKEQKDKIMANLLDKITIFFQGGNVENSLMETSAKKIQTALKLVEE